eukprot:3530130-Rhodomonas_salina.1
MQSDPRHDEQYTTDASRHPSHSRSADSLLVARAVRRPVPTVCVNLPGDTDEFGQKSRYPAPASIIGKLIKDGKFGNSTAPPFYAVNFGARDGKGTG